MSAPAMRRLLPRVKRLLLITFVLAFAVSCSDSIPFDVGSPSFEVSDGASPTGGNEDVFFLPPLVSNPVGNPNYGDRPLNPDLKPFAKVCTLDGNSAHPVCMDTPGDVADLPMTLNGNHYQAVWNSKGHVVNSEFYRIGIYLGALEIAHRDVDPGKGGSCTTDDEFCTVKSNWVIKVRIESAAACIALDDNFDPDTQPCATASVDPGDHVLLQDEEDPIGVARVETGSGTINLQRCTDLRERSSIADGRIDLPTFGDCVVIDALDEDAAVAGTATVCNAFDEGLAAGLSGAQMGRATVHRFSTEVEIPGTYALPHAEFEDACNTPAPFQGRVINEFTGAERFAMQLHRAWWTIARKVGSLAEPAPLWASVAAVCNRGGCTSTDGFRSDYEAALSAGIVRVDYGPDGDIGDRLNGAVVEDVRVQAWDSGECDEEGCEPESEPVNNVRLTVTVTGDAQVRPGSSSDPDDFGATATIYTGSDGIALFDVLVDGASMISVSGIGVAIGMGNVQAPSMNDENAEAVYAQDTPALQFTVEGFEYTIQQEEAPEIGVHAIQGEDNIEGFYSYSNSSAHTGLEQTDASILFIYDDGSVRSLVAIHDDADDPDDGGRVVFDFSEFPGTAGFLIHDDPDDEYTHNGANQADWQWTNLHTDGTAISPLPGTYWSLTITPTFNATPVAGRPNTMGGMITAWKFLTNGGEEVLDMTKPITIRGAGSP